MVTNAGDSRAALEVLAANGVQTIIQRDDGFTPTPVISRAILVYNRARPEHLADGIVITPSHNPELIEPRDPSSAATSSGCFICGCGLKSLPVMGKAKATMKVLPYAFLNT